MKTSRETEKKTHIIKNVSMDSDALVLRAKFLQVLASNIINGQKTRVSEFYEVMRDHYRVAQLSDKQQHDALMLARHLYDVVIKGAVRRKVENLKELRQQFGDVHAPIRAAQRAAPAKEAQSLATCQATYANRYTKHKKVFDEATQKYIMVPAGKPMFDGSNWLGCSKVGRECCGYVPGCEWKGHGKGCQKTSAVVFTAKRDFAFDSDAYKALNPFDDGGLCNPDGNYKGGCSHLSRNCCNSQETCKYQQGRGCRTLFPADEEKLKAQLPATLARVIREFQAQGFSTSELTFREVFTVLEREVKSDLDYKPMFDYVLSLMLPYGIQFDERNERKKGEKNEEERQFAGNTVEARIKQAVREFVLAARAQGRPLSGDVNSTQFKDAAARILGKVRNSLYPGMNKKERTAFANKFFPAIRDTLAVVVAELGDVGNNATGAFAEGLKEDLGRVRLVVNTAVDRLNTRMAESNYTLDRRQVVKDVFDETIRALASEKVFLSAAFKAVLKKALTAAAVQAKDVNAVLSDNLKNIRLAILQANAELDEDKKFLTDNSGNPEEDTWLEKLILYLEKQGAKLKKRDNDEAAILKSWLDEVKRLVNDKRTFKLIEQKLAKIIQIQRYVKRFKVSAEWRRETQKYVQQQQKAYQRRAQAQEKVHGDRAEAQVRIQPFSLREIRRALEKAEAGKANEGWIRNMMKFLKEEREALRFRTEEELSENEINIKLLEILKETYTVKKHYAQWKLFLQKLREEIAKAPQGAGEVGEVLQPPGVAAAAAAAGVAAQAAEEAVDAALQARSDAAVVGTGLAAANAADAVESANQAVFAAYSAKEASKAASEANEQGDVVGAGAHAAEAQRSSREAQNAAADAKRSASASKSLSRDAAGSPLLEANAEDAANRVLARSLSQQLVQEARSPSPVQAPVQAAAEDATNRVLARTLSQQLVQEASPPRAPVLQAAEAILEAKARSPSPNEGLNEIAQQVGMERSRLVGILQQAQAAGVPRDRIVKFIEDAKARNVSFDTFLQVEKVAQTQGSTANATLLRIKDQAAYKQYRTNEAKANAYLEKQALKFASQQV